jgi:hypothetical protein
LIELERILKFYGKLKCPVLVDSIFNGGAPATRIGPMSIQATSGRGKVRIVANSGASGDGDE